MKLKDFKQRISDLALKVLLTQSGSHCKGCPLVECCKKNTKLILALLTFGCVSASAQEFNATYCGELQTDFSHKSAFLSQLNLGVSWSVSSSLSLEAATISLAKTGGPLLDDLQGYSNLDAENTTLSLSSLGLRWLGGHHELFLGVHTINEHYFASPLLALFTNSSCGIFPTLSATGDIANYPLSSLGVEYQWTPDSAWTLTASLYNGRGFDGFRMFRLSPGTDKLFAITQINYNHKGSGYYIGGAYSHSYVVWGYAEQRLGDRVSLLCEASVSSAGAACRGYYGLGVSVNVGTTTGGLHLDYADFAERDEWAAELTWHIPVSPHFTLRPAFHAVLRQGVVGLLRAEVAF